MSTSFIPPQPRNSALTPEEWAEAWTVCDEVDRQRLDRMEEALHRIAEWSEAYPLAVFPEPDGAYYQSAAEVLKANGMTLDRLSAAAMRHVIRQVGKIAKDGLA